MIPGGYTEDKLVERPAIALLNELAWFFNTLSGALGSGHAFPTANEAL